MISFPQTKTDQQGQWDDAIWHVYATLKNPKTCCHSALTCYLFDNPGNPCKAIPQDRTGSSAHNVDGWAMATDITVNGGNKLFPGAITKYFHKVCNYFVIFESLLSLSHLFAIACAMNSGNQTE